MRHTEGLKPLAMIAAAILLAGCAYKGVVIQIDQTTDQKAGGSAIGGSTTGDTPALTQAALEKMSGVIQPLDWKQFRKLLEVLPMGDRLTVLRGLTGDADMTVEEAAALYGGAQ